MIHIFNSKLKRFSIQFTAITSKNVECFAEKKIRGEVLDFLIFCRWSAEVILDEFITYTISFLISFSLALLVCMLAENSDTHLVGVCLPCGKSEFTIFTCFTVPLVFFGFFWFWMASNFFAIKIFCGWRRRRRIRQRKRQNHYLREVILYWCPCEIRKIYVRPSNHCTIVYWTLVPDLSNSIYLFCVCVFLLFFDFIFRWADDEQIATQFRFLFFRLLERERSVCGLKLYRSNTVCVHIE